MFKTGVDQRIYGLTLDEQLRKEFTLTPLQRQSAEWASRYCGLNLNQLFNSAERALHRRKLRKIRQQIARELAELEAARKKRLAMETGAEAASLDARQIPSLRCPP
jgi:hypothetical protein